MTTIPQKYKNKVIWLSRRVAQVFSLFNYTWRDSILPPTSEEIYESFCRLYRELMDNPSADFISSWRLTVSRTTYWDEDGTDISFDFRIEETFYE